MNRILPLMVALAFVAVHPALVSADVAYVARGPGHVFSSVDAAAVDALALAHRNQLSSSQPRLSRGGTILEVRGGYTYERIETARPSHPNSLTLRLGRNAVAHFHTYPSQGPRLDRQNERHSRTDRRVVDSLDAKRRPSFVLTPSLRVVVYPGRTTAQDRDRLVADLSQPISAGAIAQF